MSCGWPFHHDKDCQECEQWETKYAENLDQYLRELDAARLARRKTTKRGASAPEQQQ